jgi:hypothetical protein
MMMLTLRSGRVIPNHVPFQASQWEERQYSVTWEQIWLLLTEEGRQGRRRAVGKLLLSPTPIGM